MFPLARTPPPAGPYRYEATAYTLLIVIGIRLKRGQGEATFGSVGQNIMGFSGGTVLKSHRLFSLEFATQTPYINLRSFTRAA
jgi:hypothetical protein